DAVLRIRAAAQRHGHVQEVIVQNFRAKPRTAMAAHDDLELQEYVAAVAVTRLLLGPKARVQAPPNLSDSTELGLLLRAGVDDWGGVSPLTPDHVNPERPWPNIDKLAALSAEAGFEPRERLAAQPPYVLQPDPWLDRVVLAALLHAEQHPAGLSDAEYLALLGADGTDLENLCALADAVRADVNGDDVTYVVNRNINFTNVCYTGCRFCAFAQRRTDADAYTLSMQQVGDRVDQAWAAGATEICMQGGIHPDLPGTAYFDLAREVKSRQPAIHLHAFSPMEIVNGAARTGLSFTDFLTALKDAGLDSVPGTAAEILDDDVR